MCPCWVGLDESSKRPKRSCDPSTLARPITENVHERSEQPTHAMVRACFKALIDAEKVPTTVAASDQCTAETKHSSAHSGH